MIPAAFGVINEALGSLNDILTGWTVHTTPVILQHPPSRRATHKSMIEQNLAIIDLWDTELSKLSQKISDAKNLVLRKRAACASALTPIAGLPVELLGEIFQMVANTFNNQSVAVISAVCSLWRTIALNQPHLWATIEFSIGGSPYRAATYFARNRSTPLRVEVGDQRMHWGALIFESLPTVNLQLEALHWGSSLDMAELLHDPGDPQSEFTTLKTLTLSLPHSCRTCGIWWTDIEPELSFLDSVRFPALRHLELTRFVLNISQSIIPQLEYLKLDSVRLNTNGCSNTLRHARSLKTLIIDKSSDAELFFQGDPGISNDVYVLQSLENMQLSWCSYELTGMILKTFRCPSLLELHLSNVTQGLALSASGPFLNHLAHTVSRP
ncbi:hypothetical protein DL93DRAFT_405356 [Clavulina sp. PMI_390]|nr:hypothetical protein DL93DRAFT_405356 [Clavulina sp. PMI_390]